MSAPIRNLTSPQIVKITSSYFLGFNLNLSWTTRNILTERIRCSTFTRLDENSLFSFFWSMVNFPFLGVLIGVSIKSSPRYPKSPLKFCLGSKLLRFDRHKVISLFGPGSPATTSTISLASGKATSDF